jgi:hypothetical protein
MYPIFVQKAEELRDCWDKIIGPSSSMPYPTPPSTPPGDGKSNTAEISLPRRKSPGIHRRRLRLDEQGYLDAIGLAGFGYSFDSLMDRM